MVVVNILGNTFEDVCDRKKQQLYVKYFSEDWRPRKAEVFGHQHQE